MSELAQRAALNLLAQETPERLSNLLKAGPQFLGHELRKNWLPEGWTPVRENQGSFSNNLSPDSAEASEAATQDADREEAAGKAWATLPEPQRRMFLEAVRILTPESGAEKDLQRTLEMNLPSGPEPSELS